MVLEGHSVHQHDPALLNKKEDEAMYVDDQAPVFEITFFKVEPAAARVLGNDHDCV